jgi:BirA family transcriptional regulator, biotin operon repressor / biotin---[acetyl-CoA-carboxylase] ligase
MKPLLSTIADANLVWVDEIDSTNEMLARIQAVFLDDDERIFPDTLLVARRQSNGRGRGNHRWESEAGGLYASWLAYLPAASLGWLPMAAAVGLLEALDEVMAPRRFGLKWPNDVIADGAKLAGILCQSRSRGDGSWVVVGLGINIESAPELPAGVAPATSLRAQGLTGPASAAAWRIVERFLAGIRPALGDPARTRTVWATRSVHKAGDVLRVRSGGETVRGEFAGFGEDGTLQLRAEGDLRSFSAAELVSPLGEGGGCDAAGA